MAMRGRSIRVLRLTVSRRFEPTRRGKAAMASGYEVVVPLRRRGTDRGVGAVEMEDAGSSSDTQAATRTVAGGA